MLFLKNICNKRNTYFLFLYNSVKHNSRDGKWKDSLIKFVPTRASTDIFKAIRDNPCVLITGPFGSGKTGIAYHAILNLEKEGFKIIFAADPEEIVSRFNGHYRLLFLFDDVLGKYSSNTLNITAKWKKNATAIKTVVAKTSMVKIIITCRTYIYQLNEKFFEHLFESISFIHKNIISEKLKLSLEERRHILNSYFEPEPQTSISDEILLLYHFFPVICSSCNNDNYLEYFNHPDKVIYVEISEMQKHSDIGYLALAILVILDNRVEDTILSGTHYHSVIDPILRDICIESNFNQHPLQHLLHITYMSLVGEFVKNEKTFLSFLCPELFDVVATYFGGSCFQSILKHSSSLFIKEKLQLSTPQGNTCSHAVTVPHNMEEKFYRRLISDMNNNFIFNVLSNKHFTSQENRIRFSVCLQNNEISSNLVDAATGSNVLHFVSSLGYSDMLTFF